MAAGTMIVVTTGALITSSRSTAVTSASCLPPWS
jgi:hypothetical protein